jgi:hypothetical protein
MPPTALGDTLAHRPAFSERPLTIAKLNHVILYSSEPFRIEALFRICTTTVRASMFKKNVEIDLMLDHARKYAWCFLNVPLRALPPMLNLACKATCFSQNTG